MSAEKNIIKILKDNKIKAVITTPCKFFAPLLSAIKRDSSIKLIWPAREEEGLGISVGYYLGGMRSILLIQNSGLGNMVNAIKSLNQHYNVPFFAIISHRGTRGEKIDAQKPMGRTTPKLLSLLGIKYRILDSPMQIHKIDKTLKKSFAKNESMVFLVKPSFWKGVL